MKTIVITGASRGVGEQLAYCYAAKDVNLILIARQIDKLASVAATCQSLGANASYASLDVCNAAPFKDFLLEQDTKTPIDLIIANAGITSSLDRNWLKEPELVHEATFAINLKGVLNTINPLLNQMITRRKGQIAIMSSLAALRGLPHSPSYCSSKAAIAVYGQSLRAWLSRYQIKVSVIYPGYIKTDMSDQLIGPKPLLVSSEKAAKIIRKGLEKNKACIAFPWALHTLMKLANTLPSGMVDIILNRFEAYVTQGQ